MSETTFVTRFKLEITFHSQQTIDIEFCLDMFFMTL